MQRINMLREEVFSASFVIEKFHYLFYKKYSETKESCEYKRYAEAYYYAFDKLEPVIGEGELIVGRYDTAFDDTQNAEWNNTYRAIAESRR